MKCQLRVRSPNGNQSTASLVLRQTSLFWRGWIQDYDPDSIGYDVAKLIDVVRLKQVAQLRSAIPVPESSPLLGFFVIAKK